MDILQNLLRGFQERRERVQFNQNPVQRQNPQNAAPNNIDEVAGAAGAGDEVIVRNFDDREEDNRILINENRFKIVANGILLAFLMNENISFGKKIPFFFSLLILNKDFIRSLYNELFNNPFNDQQGATPGIIALDENED